MATAIKVNPNPPAIERLPARRERGAAAPTGADATDNAYALQRRVLPRLPISTDRRPLLPPGLHVAPFRSPNGGLYMLAIGPDQRLLAMSEVVAMSGAWMLHLQRGAELACGEPTMSLPMADAEAFLPVHVFDDCFARTGAYLAPVGLSVAPWRPRALDEGTVYLGCEPGGVLRFVYEAEPDEDPREVAFAFEVWLDEDQHGHIPTTAEFDARKRLSEAAGAEATRQFTNWFLSYKEVEPCAARRLARPHFFDEYASRFESVNEASRHTPAMKAAADRYMDRKFDPPSDVEA